MTFYYKLGNELKIDFINKDGFDIVINDINDMLLTKEELLVKLLRNDEVVKAFFNSEEEINKIFNYIISDKEIDISSIIVNERKPLFSINYHLIRRYQKLYYLLNNNDKDIDTYIEVNKNNILNTLEFFKNNNRNLIIRSRDISLIEYCNLLNSINISDYSDLEIRIDYQDWTSPITVKELYEISKMANDTVSMISTSGLSPLEKVIYTYDIVKRREYKKNEDDVSSSRDIDKIVKGNEIVCIGYANLISAILTSLKIDNHVFANLKGNHARNNVILLDDKYNINMPLFLDATGDRKVNNDDYLNKYFYFGMNLEDANNILQEDMYDVLNMQFDKLYLCFSMGKYDKDNNLKYDIIDIINNIFEYCQKDSFDTFIYYTSYQKFEEAKEFYSKIKEKYQRQLDPLILAEAIYNVRLVEKENGMIDDFAFSDIKNSILNRSYKLGLRRINNMNVDEQEKDEERVILFLNLSMNMSKKLDVLGEELEKKRVRTKVRKDDNS